MKLGRYCGIVDFHAEKCSPFALKSQWVLGSVEIDRTENKKEEQFGSLATFQFSTSAILFSKFDSLVDYRTTEKEG